MLAAALRSDTLIAIRGPGALPFKRRASDHLAPAGASHQATALRPTRRFLQRLRGLMEI